MTTKRFAVVLAAGKSTRFNSFKPKVLHSLVGKPLIVHVLEKLQNLNIKKTLVVVAQDNEEIQQLLDPYEVDFVLQKERLGTGHALMTSASKLKGNRGNVLVIYADNPLIRTQTLAKLYAALEQSDADQVLLTATNVKTSGYGRIIRNEDDKAVEIIEEKDASAQQRMIQEINAGCYCFKISTLLQELVKLSPSPKTQEYYLTDLVGIFHQANKKTITLETDHPDEILGINDREQLSVAEIKLRSEIATKWMRQGVTILDPSSVYIDDAVRIGSDTVLHPGVFLEGETKIGRSCIIYAYSHLKNAILGKNVVIDYCSIIRDSSIRPSAQVGPFAHLRQNCLIGSEVRIGNFLEVKNSTIGKGSKAAHLSYLGDAEIGENSNIGAGTITCNYDGKNKHKTTIQDGVFVGSGSQLVAPITLNKNAYVAAGSTITKDVPKDSLGIARKRQVNKKDWVKHKKKKIAEK